MNVRGGGGEMGGWGGSEETVQNLRKFHVKVHRI